MSTDLVHAFGLETAQEPQIVAFVGAGGKTSLIFNLAAQLPGKIAITTTTRLAREQVELAENALPAAVCRYPNLSPLRCTRVTLVIGPDVEADKVGGVSREVPAQLVVQEDLSFVLVEADGARLLPVKAPADHEPVLPEHVDLVVPVVGIDALGQRIRVAAHRPVLLAALLDKEIDHVLGASDLARLVTHARGGLKDVPPMTRVVAVINKVETERQLQAARKAARAMLQEERIQRVVITALERPDPVIEVQQRITAVVLAAGQSSRMGQPKLLLPWGDTTVLGCTLANLHESAVTDSLVVTGAEAEAIGAVAEDAGVPTLFNADYATGEMISSLQTAVRQLPDNAAAILVVLGDQPLVKADTINRLLIAFWRGEGDIVAPQHDGRRGNPVLIGRRYFAELLALPPGSAPRDLLGRHPVHLVEALSDAVLVDIDDPQIYEELRPK